MSEPKKASDLGDRIFDVALTVIWAYGTYSNARKSIPLGLAFAVFAVTTMMIRLHYARKDS